jgi:hypothetical protein
MKLTLRSALDGYVFFSGCAVGSTSMEAVLIQIFLRDLTADPPGVV